MMVFKEYPVLLEMMVIWEMMVFKEYPVLLEMMVFKVQLDHQE
jgi:hypothetical protein